MTYTIPKTWAAGAILTASEMNTYVRDNTLYLKDNHGFQALTNPLTSTSWDGDDTKAVSSNNALDLNAVFGLPTGAKAVLISVEGYGSGVLWFHTKSGSFKCVTIRPKGSYDSQQGIVPIDTANTIYWTVAVANITFAQMQIQGYWL